MKEFKLENGTPVNEEELYSVFHGNKISLPKPLNAQALIDNNITAVLETPKPQATSLLKRVTRNGEEIDTLGNVVQAWLEVDKFSDTTDESGNLVTKASQEENYLTTELSTSKTNKLKALSKLSKEAQESGVLVGGDLIATDEEAQNLISRGINFSSRPIARTLFPIKTKDGKGKKVTKQVIETILETVGEHVASKMDIEVDMIMVIDNIEANTGITLAQRINQINATDIKVIWQV